MSKFRLKVLRTSIAFMTLFRHWMKLETPDWDLATWSKFGYAYWSLIQQCFKFWHFLNFEGAKNIYINVMTLHLGIKGAKNIRVLKVLMWLWRILEVLDWGFMSWSLFGFGHRSFIYPCNEFQLSILILKAKEKNHVL